MWHGEHARPSRKTHHLRPYIAPAGENFTEVAAAATAGPREFHHQAHHVASLRLSSALVSTVDLHTKVGSEIQAVEGGHMIR